jgi:hypothetical protein
MRPVFSCLALLLIVGLPPAGAAGDAAALFRCEVPAGYYRIANTGRGLAIAMRGAPSQMSQPLNDLHKGEVVFSDGLRVMGDNVTWQRVKVAQTVGWIQAANLWRALPLTLGKTEVPVAGRCGDHAPLWSLRWTADSLRLSLFPDRYEVPLERVESGMAPGTALVSGSTGDATITFVYTSEACRSALGEATGFGTAHVILRQGGRERLYSGCCSADATAFVRR